MKKWPEFVKKNIEKSNHVTCHFGHPPDWDLDISKYDDMETLGIGDEVIQVPVIEISSGSRYKNALSKAREKLKKNARNRGANAILMMSINIDPNAGIRGADFKDQKMMPASTGNAVIRAQGEFYFFPNLKPSLRGWSISKKIKFLRDVGKINQKTFSEKVGLAQSTVSEIESGKLEPKEKTLKKITDHFNIDLDSFK